MYEVVIAVEIFATVDFVSVKKYKRDQADNLLVEGCVQPSRSHVRAGLAGGG